MALNLDKSNTSKTPTAPNKGNKGLNLVKSEIVVTAKGEISKETSSNTSENVSDLSNSEISPQSDLKISKNEKITNDPRDSNKSAKKEYEWKRSLVLIVIVGIVLLSGGFLWSSFLNNLVPVNAANESESVLTTVVPESKPLESNTNQNKVTNGENNLNNPNNVIIGEDNTTTNNDYINKPSVAAYNNADDSSVRSLSATNSNTNNPRSESDLITTSNEAKAMQVIRGDYGNGLARRRALGDDYKAIQAKVNELYRNRLSQ